MTDKNSKATIVRSPGVCGGRPRIAGSRITVDHLVTYDRILGDEGGVAGLLRAYPHLTARQVQTAFEYYRTHTAEIDEIINRQNQQLIAEGQVPYEPAKRV